VAVQLADGSSVTGRIGACDDDGVELVLERTRRRIAYGDIGKAVVQVEFNRPADADETTEEEV
jgi:ribosome maturation factor RimP